MQTDCMPQAMLQKPGMKLHCWEVATFASNVPPTGLRKHYPFFHQYYVAGSEGKLIVVTACEQVLEPF